MVGKIVIIKCRIFFNNQLSIVLTKLEAIHEKLIQLNVVGLIKINWFIKTGISLYYITNNLRMLYCRIYNIEYENTSENVRQLVTIIIYKYFIRH